MKFIKLISCATSGMLLAGTLIANAASFTVISTNDSGAGTLRAAISNANVSAGSDHTINFNIPLLDGSVKTITPESPLPGIDVSVTIDGYTQDDAAANTLSNGNNAILRIVLDGINAGAADGLSLAASNSIVRGLVISRFGQNGISVLGTAAVGNLIVGNFIGTDVTGAIARGNDNGVFIGAPATIVGGTAPADRNLISGNGENGIRTGAPSDTNSVIQGNFIGVSVTGTNRLGNQTDGILLQTTRALIIGGDAPGAGNVISGNGANGINVESGGHFIIGNFIGTDSTGTLNLSNALDGVLLASIATNNTVGGSTGNLIAFNGGDGVNVGQNLSATNNVISVNSIYSNNGLGIDLGVSGITSNDDCDADNGGNKLQNFPVIVVASNSASSTVIEGTLNSAPSTTFLLEFFANTECDPSSNGEGEFFLGDTNVTSSAGCSNQFAVTLPVVIPNASFITATATDPAGNTSEFSPCVFLSTPFTGRVDCALSPLVDTNTVGAAHTVTSTVTTNGNPAVGVTVDFLVTAGPHTNATNSGVTDGAGEATFQYTGDGGPGTDSIRAIATFSGQSTTCTATKVWVATGGTNQPPAALCNNVTTNTAANCLTAVPAAAVDNGSSDPDGDPITRTLSPPGPYGLGSNTVMLVVADDQGGTNACSATILVIDTTRPTISCAGSVVTNVIAGVSNAIVTFTAPVVTDNCATGTAFCTPASDSSFPLGTNTVTCTAIDTGGNTNTCAFTVTVQQGPVVVHDLAITKMKVPRKIDISSGAVTGTVTVTIQNRCAHVETITNFTGLVSVVGQSLSNVCPNAVVQLRANPPNIGKTLKPKQSMKVVFNVIFNCANSPLKGAGNEDFSFTATVNHAAIDGNADSHPACDACPRAALGVDNAAGLNIKDKGCGVKSKTTGNLVAPLTDVVGGNQ